MTNSWKIGGVTLELREDGTFFIYQPDSSRVLDQQTAWDVARAITSAVTGRELVVADSESESSAQSTVPGGIISTSFGAVDPTVNGELAGTDLTDTEKEADRNASEARVLLDEMAAAAEADGSADTVTEFGPPRTEAPKPTPRRRGRPPKAKP